MDNVVLWHDKLKSLCNIQYVDVEYASFDMAKMANPDIQGTEYQKGTLFEYEVKEYLLEKYNRKCVYCGAKDVPLNKDHWIPQNPRKGEPKGSDRIGNLVLACIPCNQKKKNIPGPVFVQDKTVLKRIEANLSRPLANATQTNILRHFILDQFKGIYGEYATGYYAAMTKYNRHKLNLPKTHAVDALCCGNVSKVNMPKGIPVLYIKSIGRGNRSMAIINKRGFPISYRSRIKKLGGYQTGDICVVNIKDRKNAKAGTYTVRLVKSAKAFQAVINKSVIGISLSSIVKIIHRSDGYGYENIKLDFK